MSPRRRHPVATIAVLAVLVLVVAAGAGIVGIHKLHVAIFGNTTTTVPGSQYLPEESRKVAAAEAAVNVRLPGREGAPAPALGSPAFNRVLPSHDVVGFFPSYELPHLGETDLSGLTDVVYYGLQVEAGGALLERPSASLGWAAIDNGAVQSLVKEAHADGDRVLLSLYSTDQGVIGTLSGPGAVAAGRKLAAEVAHIISGNGFDGADLDLEGQAAGERAGFVRFVSAFSSGLKATNPSLAIMLNTYPQSAIDPTSFFDVRALAPYVSQLFVMAYDMGDTEVPSPDAPLVGYDLSDASSLADYDGAGLGSKVILGVPFYGYDFPASSAQPPSDAVGIPYTVTYSDVVQSIEQDGHKPLWDPQSETPFVSFKRDGQWHQTWFDNPVSIALKTALSAQFDVAGVGAWELGMAGGSPEMLSVLAGGSPVDKEPLARR